MKRPYCHDKQPHERRPSLRCHYNRHGKAKTAFGDGNDAEAFIAEHGLDGYAAYRCKVCSLFHIGQ